MTTAERNAAIMDAIRAYRATPEYIEQLRQDSIDRDAYFAMERHEGDCYCARCMSEFTRG